MSPEIKLPIEPGRRWIRISRDGTVQYGWPDGGGSVGTAVFFGSALENWLWMPVTLCVALYALWRKKA